MSLFQTRYRTYYSMLCITGLWPFDDSTFAKIQRVAFVIITLFYLSFQVTNNALILYCTFDLYLCIFCGMFAYERFGYLLYVRLNFPSLFQFQSDNLFSFSAFGIPIVWRFVCGLLSLEKGMHVLLQRIPI